MNKKEKEIKTMKALDKAMYNLTDAVVYGEELKPISKQTLKKVIPLIDNKIIEYTKEADLIDVFDEKDERRKKAYTDYIEILKKMKKLTELF